MSHTITSRGRVLRLIGCHTRNLVVREQQWWPRSDFPSTTAAVTSSNLDSHASLSTSASTSISTRGHGAIESLPSPLNSHVTMSTSAIRLNISQRATKKLIHNHAPLKNLEVPLVSSVHPADSNPSGIMSQLHLDALQSPKEIEDTIETVMPFSGIPEAKGIPFLGTQPERLWAGGPSYLYKYIDDKHRELGNVFKINLGGTNIIFIADPEAARQVYANEGSTPWHYVPPDWELYNQTYGVSRGIFFMHGDEWLANRRLLNPHLLRPAAVTHHVPALADVARDALSDWMSDEKSSSGELNPVINLERRLYRWALESLCVQMFGHGCGFLSGLHDEFLEAVENISVESNNMQNTLSPDRAKRYNLPVWKRFVHANTIAMEKARALAEQELSIAQDRISAGLEEPTALVDHLINTENLDHETIVKHVVDLLMAAADTTANSLGWCLYLIGQHQEEQQKARDEVLAATGGDITKLTASSLAAVPYVKGVLKEGLRMYPVASFLLRALSQDAVLGGYHAPAGTIVSLSVYSTGRDSRNFSDAQEFIPERWMRRQSSAANTCPRQSTGRHHSHAFLPFGIGSRSCIGRRLAETQLQVFLAQLLATCQVTTLQPVHMTMRMVSVPSEPLQIAIQPYND